MCLMAMPLSVRFCFLLSCFELDDGEAGVKREINATLLKCKNLIRTMSLGFLNNMNFRKLLVSGFMTEL
jgi:hypothetical protein